MNLELFIAKRLTSKGSHRFSQPIIRIATLAIALSLAVMILATAVVTGFQKEIRDKVIGFGSHIQVTHFSDGNSYESQVLHHSDSLKEVLSTLPEIAHIESFATKAGIIKNKEDIHGVVLKGVGSDFNSSFFSSNLIAGEIEVYNDTLTSSRVLISNYMAKLLKLETQDKFVMYFVQQPPRARQFVVSGIYETGMNELDELMVIGDIRHIQKLNGWTPSDVGGLALTINDFEQLDRLTEEVYHAIGFDLNAQNIRQLQPQIFDWLQLQDLNVQVIIFLMLLVAAINMITALLILILERTQLIGILKALGVPNWNIRKIFLFNAAYLISKGLFWGNLFGIGLALLQQHFQLIQLDEATYYMATVPIHLQLGALLLLNVGALVICWLMLILPSYLITKISPIKAIRFQ